MIFDRIELKDHDYGTVKKSSKVRKIKFKSLSFLNISKVWNNFRLKYYNERLEKAKDKVVDMEFGAGSFDRHTGEEASRAETKILRKAKAVAKLEAKINFLRFGTEVTDDFVSSRAIKIKNNMMKNMRYNADAAYSIPSDKKELIFAEEPTTEDVIKAAKKGVDDALSRIMKKREVTPVKEETASQEETTPVIKAPTKEEIRKTVDEMFAEEQKRREQATEVTTEETTEAVVEEVVAPVEVHEEVVETPIVGKEEVKETVQAELDQIDVVPTVNKEDVADAIQDELAKINVTKNQSNKVNPYINEDGTYRMKREDIDEDFRVTRVAMTDREKRIEDLRKVNLTVQSAFIKSMQIIKENLDRQAEEEKKASEAVTPATEVSREMPEVAPERTPAQEVKALTEAVDKATTKDDLASIMASVARLQEEQAAAKTREAEIAANEENLKAEKNKAIEELLAYQASLQADVASRTEGLSAREAQNNAMAQEIDSIRQVMGRR